MIRVIHKGPECKMVFIPKGTHYTKVPPGCWEDWVDYNRLSVRMNALKRHCQSKDYVGVDWTFPNYRRNLPFDKGEGVGEYTIIDALFYAPLDWPCDERNELGEVAP